MRRKKIHSMLQHENSTSKIDDKKDKKHHSHAGNRTPATAVRAPDPNH